MKQPKFINDNQIKINTGHKTFDLQTNLIASGNIIANTQYSKHIRSKNETGWFPHNRPEGFLQQWDCDNYQQAMNTPKYILTIAKEHADRFDGIYLYTFFHVYKNKRMIHGYVFTQSNTDNFIQYLQHGMYGTVRYERSLKILKTVIPYISNQNN